MGHVVMIISRDYIELFWTILITVAKNSVWHKISCPLTNSEDFLYGGCGTDACRRGGGSLHSSPPPLRLYPR